MATEIERKFLLQSSAWRASVHRSTLLRQGYLANNDRVSVRVRIAGEGGFLSVKAMTPGLARAEYEVQVPLVDAQQMLDTLCERPLIEKWRHLVDVGGMTWEIDEFLGDNAGLIVAELELPATDATFVRPPWVGQEVTQDVRYYNFKLAQHPYCRWPEQS